MNRISVLFFLVDLCFSYLFIHEIGKFRVMCGIPLRYNIILDCKLTELGASLSGDLHLYLESPIKGDLEHDPCE